MASPAPLPPPLLETRAIVPKIAVTGLLIALGLCGLVGHSEWTYGKMSRALDADIATYKRQRWERPALRGVGEPGNAAEAAYSAVAEMKPLKPAEREALAKLLHFGSAPDAELLQLLQEGAATVAALRQAGTHPFSMTTLDPGMGEGMLGPDYPSLLDAALLMLGSAAVSAEADACLKLGADAIRFGQDLIPGAPLESASISMRINTLAGPVMSRCASRADRDTLIRASMELQSLASHCPPAGTGLELRDVMAAVDIRTAGARGKGNPITQLRRRPDLFAAWAVYGEPTRWRQISGEDYPEALEAWRREVDERNRMGLARLNEASDGVMEWLYDDMRGHAVLRTLAVGVATLAERARRGKLPREPAKLKVLALRDPFDGLPLKWRTSQDASELTIWSIGENLRDDLGTQDWAPDAPLDVTLHFDLTVAKQEPVAKSRRSRRRRKNDG